MIKLPYGISNYEEIVNDNYLYIDKTPYIEKLENLPDKRILFLRPRKFGKTLFTSVIEHYYDIKEKEKFEKLFSNTYIGKNPTSLKNSYCILRFNFSGIDTQTPESTISGFKNSTIESIKIFVAKYNLDFNINEQQVAEEILNALFSAFFIQKLDQKIYVIIDEYDHFANELLCFDTEHFKSLVSKNGKMRKWFEILKKGTETVIDRIFITGVAPITLDSLTSGFNIGTDISQDIRFNEMMGFTKEEVKSIMNKVPLDITTQEKLMPIIKENYDGYMFSKKATKKIYNSNMTLYFLKQYIPFNQIPDKLIDLNIASDYSKLEKMINLYNGKDKEEIIQKSIAEEKIISEITEKFNPAMEFTEQDFISILYYLGYLTIDGDMLGEPILKIPNKIMKSLYADYFLNVTKRRANLWAENNLSALNQEIALEGKIEKAVELLGKYLKNLSNRDYIKFDEKYIKLIFYCLSMNLAAFRVKSEMEVESSYPDIVLIPKFENDKLYEIMIEFKYIKKEDYEKEGEALLKRIQKEAKEQILKYSQTDEFKNHNLLRKYTIVAIKDDLYVEEIL